MKETKPFGTWEEIEALAREDPTVHACLNVSYQYKLSREDTLVLMVIEQSKMKASILDASIKCHETCVKPAMLYFNKRGE
jgi:hypothetical protein